MRKNSSKKHGVNSLLNRSQSAMEYLMTYGWAILIIAIVLVALFSLGIFNSANFAPRAQPGSCEVLRNSAQTSLVGQCNGMLPEYVAQFDGISKINVSSIPELPSGNQPRTLTAWFFVSPSDNTNYNGIAGTSGAGTSTMLTIYLGGRRVCIDAWESSNQCGNGNNTVQVGSFEFVAAAYNSTNYNLVGYTGYGGSLYSFIAGNVILDFPQVSSTYPFLIGSRTYTPVLSGDIANVQLYNTTLTQSEIQALYKEGIGGAPINVNNLVGWWPLNGNANDYSGNDNNGNSPANVTYTSAWISGYSTP